MIIQLNNLFNDNDVDFFLNQLSDKTWEGIVFENNYINYYNRLIPEGFSKYKLYIENFLYEKYKQKFLLQTNGVWINKVSNETNKNDNFHFDRCDLSIVTYLNDNFSGGEFEYKTKDKIIQIKPKKLLSIIIDNKLEHRVLPLISGVRYSLVCFFDLIKKNEKSII
jgi:hypothetical protein